MTPDEDQASSFLHGLDVFQERVSAWMSRCFGELWRRDRRSRMHRFLEEAIELAQACDATAAEAHALVDYVFGRPAGTVEQELGGVLLTAAALAQSHSLQFGTAALKELLRVEANIDRIRRKEAAKPSGFGPLPGPDQA